ncbi:MULTISPECIES: helix-turn-helix domain-containing protein [Clostridium]|uniref:helix-turn-helix domain-containing protein n=1 Tax=Clostridium TaxID=1485 RepID=UPI001AE92FF9|nr:MULTISPECIES: helix-turn-helix transcriptional regulator [Clostridium]MBP1869030.1 transcriptional regulator with XRE-family HTH domain [Clostridium tertium]MDU7362747.1 helix-turn-helix transcriptional regulator [Clostridium sp.]
MNIVTELKKLFLDANMTQSDVAEKIGTTQANLSKKFKNNTVYSKDIENIAESLGYELKIEFIKK